MWKKRSGGVWERKGEGREGECECQTFCFCTTFYNFLQRVFPWIEDIFKFDQILKWNKHLKMQKLMFTGKHFIVKSMKCK